MTQYLTAKTSIALISVCLATPASAELLYENGSGGSVKLYGQFSPVYQSVDDGVSTTKTLVDNAHSNTRAGIWVYQDYSSGNFSFNFETALGLRSSDGVSQTDTPSAIDWDRTKIRKIDAAFTHESWGTFYAGQGSMSSDGITGFDFGGNGMTTVNAIPDGAGSFVFRNAAGELTTVAIKEVFTNLDGGRLGRVRYDSPSLGDFTIAASVGTNILAETSSGTYYDVTLRYARDFDGTEVSGGIGFARRDHEGEKRDDTIGSLAVNFQSGFNFAIAGGSRKDDGNYGYAKIGYSADWVSSGTTSLSLDYYDGNDFGLDGRNSRSTGIGINQDIDDMNAQLYLGIRNHKLSDPSVNYKDVNSFLLGARWKF